MGALLGLFFACCWLGSSCGLLAWLLFLQVAIRACLWLFLGGVPGFCLLLAESVLEWLIVISWLCCFFYRLLSELASGIMLVC